MKIKMLLLALFLVGYNAVGQTQTSPYNNSFGGGYNLRTVTGGSVYNNAIGAFVLSNGLDATPNGNLSGGYNNAIGGQALLNNTSGSDNNVFGYKALINNLTGAGNIAIGTSSMKSNIGGVNNIGIGYESLYSNNASSGFNVAIGYRAGFLNEVGNNNVFIGNSAGYNELGSNKLYISNGVSSVPLIYGDFSERHLKCNGYFEIDYFANTSGLRFTGLTSAYNPSSTATKFLTVNGTGDVVLQNLPSGTGGAGSTTITAGTNINVTGNPIDGYVISNSLVNTNIYTNDGTINTTNGLRKVLLNDNNLLFDTTKSTNNGKIYIGYNPSFISSTGNYRLFVEDGILTEKVRVALRNAPSWADYVFASDYKLMPLKEVEAFVKENKHLPGVASAKTLAKEGIDLGAMQAKQMEKIEELTLYLIEQNKQIEKQNKEIEELKEQMKALLEKK